MVFNLECLKIGNVPGPLSVVSCNQISGTQVNLFVARVAVIFARNRVDFDLLQRTTNNDQLTPCYGTRGVLS